jgi:hypothetical protein
MSDDRFDPEQLRLSPDAIEAQQRAQGEAARKVPRSHPAGVAEFTMMPSSWRVQLRERPPALTIWRCICCT